MQERFRRLDAEAQTLLAVDEGKGWHPATADAIAAVFSSGLLWEYCERTAEGQVLEADDLSALWYLLAIIAENGGQPVTFPFNRRPRPGILRSWSDERLRHLAANEFITLETNGNLRTISLGPRTEQLRREFREEFERRARERIDAQKKARKKVAPAT